MSTPGSALQRRLDIERNPLFVAGQNFTRVAVSGVLRHWCGLTIEGVPMFEGITQCILAPTHASHLDFWAVLEGLPPRLRRQTYVAAARDYFYAKPLRRWTTRALAYHNFPLDRRSRAPREYEHLKHLLQAGLSLLLFPEGSRSRDGHPQAFKPIASMLAADTGVPLIPVTVRGTFDSLPAGRWLPRRRPIRVAFAHPIVPSEETGAVTGSFHARIRRIQLMLETAIAQGEGDGQ